MTIKVGYGPEPPNTTTVRYDQANGAISFGYILSPDFTATSATGDERTNTPAGSPDVRAVDVANMAGMRYKQPATADIDIGPVIVTDNRKGDSTYGKDFIPVVNARANHGTVHQVWVDGSIALDAGTSYLKAQDASFAALEAVAKTDAGVFAVSLETKTTAVGGELVNCMLIVR